MNKTKPEDTSVDDFLLQIEDEEKRNDCIEICTLMSEITNSPAVMWGTSIVGFDNYHYQYASGRKGNWMKIGFSPRKSKSNPLHYARVFILRRFAFTAWSA